VLRSIDMMMPTQIIIVSIDEPPMANERQRDADDRGEAHHHHQVDRDVEEDRRRQARRNSCPSGSCAAGDPHAPAHQQE
jgi:hypothetical protein